MNYDSSESIDNDNVEKKKKIEFLDILIIVLILVILSLLGYEFYKNKNESETLKLSNKKKYMIVNKIDNEGFAKLDYSSELDLIKKLGFNEIDEKIYTYDKNISEQKAYYATNKYYDDRDDLDELEIVFNQDNTEVYQIEASLIYKDEDFTLSSSVGDIINIVSNFVNIELNTDLIEYAYEDLMIKKKDNNNILTSTEYDKTELANLSYTFKYENNCYVISIIIQAK